MLSVFQDQGIDRVFLVPGESYLGILDALCDFPGIDAVTCRHESGAGFMAVADARLGGRPGIALVSRGPGATNAAIAVHTAQQDAIPMILIVGQVPRADLRREAFQEIDYRRMYGTIAKWVFEATDPGQLAEAAFKAIRVATSGTPGPVVLVIPEDLQQQQVARPHWIAREHAHTEPEASTLNELLRRIEAAERPLIVAGGAFEAPGGRAALAALAEAWQVPVALSFRRLDLFSNLHPLYVGELGLANPKPQIDAFRQSDLILALGTRFGDITSQGYSFPDLPCPAQTFVHAYADDHMVGLHFAPDFGLVCDPIALARALTPAAKPNIAPPRSVWTARLKEIFHGAGGLAAAQGRGRHRFRAGGEGGARAGERRCHRVPGRRNLRRPGLPALRLRAAAAADVAAVGHHGLRHARCDRRAAAFSRTAGDLHGG